jgi:hypothetical protein
VDVDNDQEIRGRKIFSGGIYIYKNGILHNINDDIANLLDHLPTVIEVPYGSSLELTEEQLVDYAWFEVIGRHTMAFGQDGAQYPDRPIDFDYARFTVQYNQNHYYYGSLYLYGIYDNEFQRMTNAPTVNRSVTVTPLDPQSYDITEPRPVLVYLHGGAAIGSSS